MPRRLIASGSPFEPVIGFSRAVVEGHHVVVAWTAPVMPAGSGPEHVVRTRTYLTDAGDWEEVGRAHGEVFADIRPASTRIVVNGFLDPRWLVEMEADAILP